MARVWPPQFDSQPLVNGYSQSKGSRLRRSQNPTAGPAKVRRMAGKRPDIISGTWIFKNFDQLTAFVDWIDDVSSGLAGGLYAFDWVHPLTKTLLRMRLLPESEDILHTAKPFGKTLGWELALKFEVLR